MPKAGYTHIHVVLDRSGSMAPIAADVQGGLNTFIAEQQKVPGECSFSLVDFDHEYRTLVEWTDIHKVALITNYEPRGNTALHDALCRSIDDLGLRLAALPEHERPSKIIVVVQTDGEENASHLFTVEDVKKRVTHQHDAYGWDFLFLGANIDAFAAGSALGVAATNTAQWNSTSRGLRAAYGISSAAVSRSRGPGGQSVSYTPDEQKKIRDTK